MPRNKSIEPERSQSGQPERLVHADVVLRASRRVLRPLIKVMIAHGITLPALLAVLKQVYVEVAGEEFRIAGKPVTDSRISMLTGVHRKDVRTLRQSGVPATAPAGMSVSATVVGRWLGDPRYGSPGAPRVLPRTAGPAEPSFASLVAEVSQDIRPRTVLDELVRQGLVAEDETAEQVRLLADAFVPRNDGPAMLDFFASNLHDHAAAATENLLAAPGKAPFLERAVYYNGLTPASVDALEASARQLGLRALTELNGDALARQRADQGDAAADRRFRFGVYFYRSPRPPEAAADPAPNDDGNRET